MAKTAKTKHCPSCGEVKSTEQFSKYKRAKDGLQPHCKECQKIRTKPLVKKILKAGDVGRIYTITNPEGIVYTGKTFRKLNQRFNDHRAHYKSYSKNGISTLPLLHKSFDMWGIDNHNFKLVKEYPNISKEDLREIETTLIQTYKKINKSLNKND